MITSSVCKYDHFKNDWYREWASILSDTVDVSTEMPRSYRKTWEWAIILQALRERGMMRYGRKGLGFAVGREPLSSIFAAHGVGILATDLSVEQSEGGWIDTGQHSSSKDHLFYENLVERAQFDSAVSFQSADMRTLEGLPEGEFDFIWSSCALEHLGSREAGFDFVRNSTQLLKHGGIACHTTEYSVSSIDGIDIDKNSCVYGRKEIEEFSYTLRLARSAMEAMEYDAGHHDFDLNYDEYPYFEPGKVHLKLKVGGTICTSALMIIRKF